MMNRTHFATVNYVCLRQGAQADEHVCRQSRQEVVVGKVELPAGEEGDTRSDAHQSTPAQHERMRVSSSKRWNRAGEGKAKGLQRRKSAKKKGSKVPAPQEKANVVNTGTNM
jgi:hypothetical protein